MGIRLRSAAVGLLACGALYADFTYEETSRVTGGAIVGMMKFAGAFSKDARRVTEPINSVIAIKGNRMVRKSQLTATITDLDAETITTINFDKKTYSTITFAQMKKAMEDAMNQMEASKAQQKSQAPSQDAPNVDMKFDVKVKDTGQTRTINGLPAHEVIMTMTMEGTDQKSGAKGGMDMTTDSWLVPKIPGYEEVHEFFRRMAEKLGWVPGAGGGMMNRPDIARGMSELYKEGAKLDGIPVLQVVKMGGTVDGGPQSADGNQNQRQSNSSQSSAPPPTSVSSALGSALGGRFGLGRKKNPPPEQSTDSSSSQGGSGSASGSLMEMTMEVTNYSSAPADAGLFAVPAGFKQVEPEMMNSRRSR